MRHLKSGKKLGRTKSHRKALLNSLATALFEHKKIHTTEAKAKALRPFAEKIITRAKNAHLKEQQGLLPEGQTIDVHSRREVGKLIKNKAVLQELFDTIAPAVESRNGGYTRIVKTGFRLGDAGSKALIELVDWSNPQDGPVSKRKKKKVNAKPKVAAPKATEETPVVADEIIGNSTEVTAEISENTNETVETTETLETITEEVVESSENDETTIEEGVESIEVVAEESTEVADETTTENADEPKSDEDKKSE